MRPNVFINSIFSKKTILLLQDKFMLLGKDNWNINLYLTFKLLVLLFTFLFTLFIGKYGYIISPILCVLVYISYDRVLLNTRIKKRSNILEHDAIFFFEVLALTMQSEQNLKLCISNTCDAIDSTLSNEFKLALKEASMGKSLTEALNNLMRRIPSKSVNNVILNLIESNVYGNALSGTLENQINYITDKRILEIKSKINTMPTKISIASVLLFLPIMMLLIIGPILIKFILN